jgi:hypothetical protein
MQGAVVAKEVVTQYGWPYGWLRPDFLEAADVDVRGQSAQKIVNGRILASRAITDRPGTEFRRTVGATAVGPISWRPASGVSFGCYVEDDKLVIVDTDEETTVTTVTPVPWSTADEAWIVDMGSELLLGPTVPKFLSYEDGSIVISTFAFAENTGGELAQPYWAFNRGVTLAPSASSGAITVTASAPVFSAAYVGTRIRYSGREIIVTGYTSPTQISGTVVTQLPPTFVINIGDVSGFTVGQVVVGATSGWEAQIVIVDAVNGLLACVTIDGYQGPTPAETVSSPTASATVNALEETNPHGTTIWDEQLISPVRGYPRSAALAQGRLIFVDFPLLPDVVALSSSRDTTDFGVGLDDDDAIVRRAGADGNRFLHVISSVDVILLSTHGAYYLKTRDGTPLTPASFHAVRFDARGSSEIRPVLVEDSVVFVEASGEDLAVALLDGNVYLEWSVARLSRYHSHLINAPVALIGTADSGQMSESYLLCVNADGSLAALSWEGRFAREAIGFVRWETEGAFVGGGVAWGRHHVMVDRVLDGSTVRILEQMNPDVLLDCAIVDSASTAAPHLATKDVSVRFGGWHLGSFETDGSGNLLELPTIVGERQIGLPFTFLLQPWPARPQSDTMMQTPRISRVAVSVLDSDIYSVRRNGTTTHRGDYAIGEDLTEPPPKRTERAVFSVLGNQDHPMIEIFRDVPGRLTILAVSQEVTI